MRQRDQRLAVKPHLFGLSSGVYRGEAPMRAKAGVVDEQVDLQAEVGDPARQRRRVVDEIAGDHVRGPRQLRCHLLHELGPSGDEDDLVAPGRELLGELGADSR